MAAAWPLVGRAEELEFVVHALGQQPGGVVVAGGAGVGKSRLATEALARLETAGRSTASCLGSRSAASVPLGALSPLLSDLPAQTADLTHLLTPPAAP